MRRCLLLSVAIWACSIPLLAQDKPAAVTAAAYLRARSESGGFSISLADVARGLAAGRAPVVLDVRTAAAHERKHLDGSVSVPLADLSRAESLRKLPTDRPIIVVDSGDSSAIEAMVLLRLSGYDAHAMIGDVAGLVPPTAASAQSRPAGEKPVIPRPADSQLDTSPPQQPEESKPINKPAAAPLQAPPLTSPLASREFWLVVAAAVVLVGATLAYVVAVQPWLRSKPLREARASLSDPTPDFEGIEALLGRAVTAGLRKEDLAEARFLLAYVRARTGRYAEATTVLSDLVRTGDTSRETAYLNLWLSVIQKRWEEAQRIYEQNSDLLKGYLEANRLAGIVYLEVGRQFLLLREIDRGLNCFERLRELGEFADEIPKDIEDNEMVVAIEALFEGKFDLARERFVSAKDRAEQRAAPTLHARLGLLVCDWRSQEIPDVDAALDRIVSEILAGEVPRAPGEGPDVFARHVLLWHTVSRLFTWLALPAKKGLPERERKVLSERLAGLRKLDPDSSDADLIEGLVAYYFATDEDGQKRAIALLRDAQNKGVGVPEVVYLLECEDRLEQVREKRLDNYLILLKSYLSDPAVPSDLRRELYEYLNQFPRFEQLGDVDVSGDSVAPTVQDLQATSETVERHVRNLFRGYGNRQGSVTTTDIDSLVGQMRQSRETISQATGDLSKAQHKLMRVAGEALLPEEPLGSEGS
jgi:rhodanese-related sulfurtransferase/tetratricopeptide (TPR) repeat protein